jgi:hypothetical protein
MSKTWRRSIPTTSAPDKSAPQFVHEDGEWMRTSSGSMTWARSPRGHQVAFLGGAPRPFVLSAPGGSAFRGLPLTAASRSCAGCGRCVARDRRGARSARRSLRSSGRSRRPASRPAPRAPPSLRPAPRRQPDRSGKCRQSEFPTIRAPSTRGVDGLTRPEQLPPREPHQCRHRLIWPNRAPRTRLNGSRE